MLDPQGVLRALSLKLKARLTERARKRKKEKERRKESLDRGRYGRGVLAIPQMRRLLYQVSLFY